MRTSSDPCCLPPKRPRQLRAAPAPQPPSGLGLARAGERPSPRPLPLARWPWLHRVREQSRRRHAQNRQGNWAQLRVCRDASSQLSAGIQTRSMHRQPSYRMLLCHAQAPTRRPPVLPDSWNSMRPSSNPSPSPVAFTNASFRLQSFLFWGHGNMENGVTHGSMAPICMACGKAWQVLSFSRRTRQLVSPRAVTSMSAHATAIRFATAKAFSSPDRSTTRT